MAVFIPNIAKGKIAYLASLPGTGDQLVWVLFSGTETDENLKDADTLAAVIALAVDEATFTGYSQQDATGIVVTVDDTNNQVKADCNNPQWSPTSVQALTRIGLFYDPDGSNTAANMIPLFIDDFVITTGTTGYLTYFVANNSFWIGS